MKTKYNEKVLRVDLSFLGVYDCILTYRIDALLFGNKSLIVEFLYIYFQTSLFLIN
jgi:hypothetical protein